MMKRCYDPKNPRFCDYGGSGITVCKKWHDFNGFLRDMGTRPDGMQLDRIDNGRGYSKGNCRWVTPTRNARNRKSNRVLEHQGIALCVADWADRIGVPGGTIIGRLRSGFPVALALSNRRIKRRR
jgi:hypothetical protein